MLQKTYSIYSDDLANQQLFIEVGQNHLACWCKKAEGKKFTAFEFFQCDDYDASTFEQLINEAKLYSKLLTLDVSNTTLVWFSAKNLILPAALNADDNFVNDNFYLMYGLDDNKKIISRNYENSLIATSIEKYLYNAAQNIFPKAQFQTACYINKNEMDNAAQLFFYPNYFSLLLYKNEALQFFKIIYYEHPEDVLYTVTNILQQYEVEKNTKIITGGFINEDSKLFELLYQYLEGLQLGAVDEALFVSTEFKEYPAHYFLPYANYLLCE